MFKKINIVLRELFFPARCVTCGRIGEYLCKNCLTDIPFIKNPSCPRCNAIYPEGRYCKRCSRGMPLQGILVAGSFHDASIKNLVYALKYEGVIDISVLMAKIMAGRIKVSRAQIDLIAFVPQSRQRTARRGFNQAEEIAKAISVELDVPLFTGLKKTKNTKAQVGLSKKEREKNLHNAFVVTEKKKLAGKSILLIDDVVTTGATLKESAKTLTGGGASQVWGGVFAKE